MNVHYQEFWILYYLTALLNFYCEHRGLWGGSHTTKNPDTHLKPLLRGTKGTKRVPQNWHLAINSFVALDTMGLRPQTPRDSGQLKL